MRQWDQNRWPLGAYPEQKLFGLFLIMTNKILTNIDQFLCFSKGRIWERNVYICGFTALFPIFITAVLTLIISQWGGYVRICIFAFLPYVFISFVGSSDLWYLQNFTKVLVTDALAGAEELRSKISLPSGVVEMEASLFYVLVYAEPFFE